jgi:hypothetical protein
MRLHRIATAAVALTAAAWAVTPGVSSAGAASSPIPRYQHIVEIMARTPS